VLTANIHFGDLDIYILGKTDCENCPSAA